MDVTTMMAAMINAHVPDTAVIMTADIPLSSPAAALCDMLKIYVPQ